MKLAMGAKPWLITPCLGMIICLIGTFFLQDILQSIFLFLTTLMVFLILFFLIFFRDPERDSGEGIVAVADGRIREIQMEQDIDCGQCIVISTFMNIYNVHVNRCPLDGIVKKVTYKPGSHLPAFTKESISNERVISILETPRGPIKIIQIAGTIARRIVPYIKEGDLLKKGERIGLIRLGSRVDIYIPKQMINKITIKPKQMAKAGEDTIATVHD